MMPSEHTYKISSATLVEVEALVQKRDYPAAYLAVANDLKAQATHGIEIDANTLTWYTDAAQINDPNATSFIHYFVRDYVSDYSKLATNKTIDDVQFQKVSNTLAIRVLGDLLASGQVLAFNKVGQEDTLPTALRPVGTFSASAPRARYQPPPMMSHHLRRLALNVARRTPPRSKLI